MKRVYPQRYNNILRLVHAHRFHRFVEVGVFQGVRTRHMIETALIHHAPSEIVYHGFDLFEEYTPEMKEKELSDRPLSMEEIRSKLAATGAQVTLYKGDSRKTVPAAREHLRDTQFAYIDGGHSYDCIEADWSNVRPLMVSGGVVLFDDYYHNPESEVGRFGCQNLMERLRKENYRVEVVGPMDEFKKPWGTLKVSMAAVHI